MCGGPYVPHFLIFFIIIFYILNYKIKYKNKIKKNKKYCFFWGLQICPSSIEFMSVTDVSNEMK